MSRCYCIWVLGALCSFTSLAHAEVNEGWYIGEEAYWEPGADLKPEQKYVLIGEAEDNYGESGGAIRHYRDIPVEVDGMHPPYQLGFEFQVTIRRVVDPHATDPDERYGPPIANPEAFFDGDFSDDEPEHDGRFVVKVLSLNDNDFMVHYPMKLDPRSSPEGGDVSNDYFFKSGERKQLGVLAKSCDISIVIEHDITDADGNPLYYEVRHPSEVGEIDGGDYDRFNRGTLKFAH